VAAAWRSPCEWPPALAYLRTLFAADEVASILRHEAMNEIAGLGALVFRLRRRIEARVSVDGELGQVLETLENRLANSQARLSARFLPSPALDARANLPALLGQLSALTGIAVEVRSTLTGAESAEAAIDADELRVALGCLLENAAEALQQAGSPQPVQMSLRAERDRLIIGVVDAGAGAAPAVFDRLLDPFFTTQQGRGGLGLKIARRIAHRWAGELLVTRAEPQGLSVELQLPAA
jgi:signal transduction histidine kinase